MLSPKLGRGSDRRRAFSPSVIVPRELSVLVASAAQIHGPRSFIVKTWRVDWSPVFTTASSPVSQIESTFKQPTPMPEQCSGASAQKGCSRSCAPARIA